MGYKMGEKWAKHCRKNEQHNVKINDEGYPIKIMAK